jgi:peptidoglycan-associated lipoprotein
MDMKKVFGVLLICLLSACASKGTQPSAEVEDKSRGVTAPSEESTRGMEATPTLNPLTDPNNILSRRSVYFDFDSYVVKDEYKSLVVAHAQYLRDNGNARALVQGNTDERGSREYNLALGQRRAEAVKKVMSVLGVQDGRVETISYGEEKPKSNGHDEQAWAQNRRADIKYPGE